MPVPLPPASGEYDSEAVKAQARAWVDGVNSAAGVSGGWRLQVLRLRTRRKFAGASAGSVTDVNGDAVSSEGAGAPDGGCDELPARLRRFVPGCPWALVDQAVRYLYEIAPYTGIIYNGVRVEGKYRPTLTQWVRDDQTNVGERGANGTYTLIQDLIEVTDCDDSLETATGASCSAYEETTFRWDADSVEPLPVECEQGVTWSIRAVSRSDEDGTYSYQLVKTTARTRHYGPSLVECGPQAEVTEESWESAYGEPGAFEARGCDVSGPIETPPCDTEPGVRTQVQYRENPDCTFDVVVRRRTSKEFSDSWRDGTACRPQDVTVARNAKVAPPAPVPAVGERVDRRLQRNEDNTYDVTDTVVRAPDPYSYSWTDGSSCRRRDVEVLGAQPSMPQPPAVPGRGRLEATVRRNDDCTWDARFETVRAPDPFVAEWVEGSACRPERVRVAEGEAAPPSVPEPGPGETVAASVSRDADCTFSSRVTVRSAPSAFSASWEEGTPCRPSETTVYDGWAELPPVPALAKGRTVQASLRREPDCTFSGTVSVATQTEDSKSWREGSPCRPVDVTETWGADSVDIPEAGEGETVSASVQRNPDCTYDVRVRTVHAAAGDSKSWREGSPCRPVETTLYDSVAGMPDVPPLEAGKTIQASFRRNDDCTFSGTVSVATQTGDSKSWREGSSCRPVDVTETWGAETVDIPEAGEGETVSASVQRNPDCTYDVRVRTVRAAAGDAGSWTEGTPCRPVETTLYDSVAGMPDVPPLEAGKTIQASFRRNDDCTFSGTVSVAETKPSGDVSWKEGTECRGVEASAWWGVKDLLGDIPSLNEDPRDHNSVSVSVSRNPDCTYDVVRKVRHPADASKDLFWEEGTPCRPVETHLYDSIPELPTDQIPGREKGKTIQASFRRNDDCTFSGTWSVAETVFTGEESWKEGTECRGIDATAWWGVDDLGRVSGLHDTPSNGDSVSVSVSRNPDCTYDVVRKVRHPADASKDLFWNEGTACFPVTTNLYDSVPELPSVDRPSVGETIQASFRRNDDCTFSGTVSKTTRNPAPVVEWNEGSCCNPTKVTMSTGLPDMPFSTLPECGEVVSQRVSRNNDCTYDVTREVMQPEYDLRHYYWKTGDKRVHFVQYFNRRAPFIIPGPSCDGGIVNNDFHRNSACLYDGTASEICPLDAGSSHTDGYTWGPNISEPVAMEYYVTPGQDRQQTGFHWTVKVGWAVEGAQKLKAYSSMRENWATGGGAGCAIEGLSTHGGYGKDEIMFSFMAVKVIQTDRIDRDLRGDRLMAEINDYVRSHAVGPTKGGLGT